MSPVNPANSTWRNNMTDFEADDGGPGDVANWDPNLCRYFFVSFRGDDNNIGSIDAPPGTTFTLADALAVAVRTTDRLAQLRPRVGAGRMAVTLFESNPDPSRPPYDKSFPGDHAGEEDRRSFTGYRTFITRGSDFTNSPADRAQLGFVIVDTPYVVQATNVGPNGFELQCTSPIVPPPPQCPHFRVKITPAGGGSPQYAPIKWGSTTNPPDPTVITLWDTPASPPINPGDIVELEWPGVVLHKFWEAPASEDPGFDAPRGSGLATYGMTFHFALLGADGPRAAYYSGVTVGQSTYANSLVSDTSAFDEVGNPWPGNFGLVFDGGLQPAGSEQDAPAQPSDVVLPKSLDLSYCASIMPAEVNLQAEYVRARRCPVMRLCVNERGGGGSLNEVLYDQLDVHQRTLVEVGACRWVTFNADGTGMNVYGAFVGPVMVPPSSRGVVAVSDLRSFAGTEPNIPGISLFPGLQELALDFHDDGQFLPITRVGSGVRCYWDAQLTQWTDVTWESVHETGFEVEGAQKISSKSLVELSRNSMGYPSAVLPCPRGVVMQLAQGPSPDAYVNGCVVMASPPDYTRFQLARATPGLAVARLLGVLLTNVVRPTPESPNGGWAVVGCDGLMSVSLNPPGGVPFGSQALPVYLSGTVDGAASLLPSLDCPTQLGQSAPTGPGTTGVSDQTLIAWRPRRDDDLRGQLVMRGCGLTRISRGQVTFDDFELCQDPQQPLGDSSASSGGAASFSITRQTAVDVATGNSGGQLYALRPSAAGPWKTTDPRSTPWYAAFRASLTYGVDEGGASGLTGLSLVDAGGFNDINFGVVQDGSSTNYSLAVGPPGAPDAVIDSGVPVDANVHTFEAWMDTNQGLIHFMIDGQEVGNPCLPPTNWNSPTIAFVPIAASGTNMDVWGGTFMWYALICEREDDSSGPQYAPSPGPRAPQPAPKKPVAPAARAPAPAVKTAKAPAPITKRGT